MIVDDDQLVRDFAVHTIEYGTNRKVATFDNGFSAWEFLQTQPQEADIIIADANIPDVDGLELLDRIKKNYPQKQFVITSGNPDLADIANKKGADAFLSKPYDARDLFTIVEQLCVRPASPAKKSESNQVEELPTQDDPPAET